MRERRLVVRELRHARPRLFVRRAEHPAPRQRRAARVSKRKTCLKILKIWSISESPGKSGCPRATISAKMHPVDHMSTAVE